MPPTRDRRPRSGSVVNISYVQLQFAPPDPPTLVRRTGSRRATQITMASASYGKQLCSCMSKPTVHLSSKKLFEACRRELQVVTVGEFKAWAHTKDLPLEEVPGFGPLGFSPEVLQPETWLSLVVHPAPGCTCSVFLDRWESCAQTAS